MPDVVLSYVTWISFLSGWGECQGMTARQRGHACSSAVSPPMTDCMGKTEIGTGVPGTGAGTGVPGTGVCCFFFAPPRLPKSRLRFPTCEETVVLSGLRATRLAMA